MHIINNPTSIYYGSLVTKIKDSKEYRDSYYCLAKIQGVRGWQEVPRNDLKEVKECELKDFSGYIVKSEQLGDDINGKVVERTIRKAFPYDEDSTLWIVKVKGIRFHLELYEDEMYKI